MRYWTFKDGTAQVGLKKLSTSARPSCAAAAAAAPWYATLVELSVEFGTEDVVSMSFRPISTVQSNNSADQVSGRPNGSQSLSHYTLDFDTEAEYRCQRERLRAVPAGWRGR